MAVWRPGDILDLSGSIGQVVGAIKTAVADGLSANATVDALKRQGMGKRRESVLSVHKALTYASRDPSIYLPSDLSLKPRAELVPKTPFRQKRKWHTVVTTVFSDPISQTNEERAITISDDDLDSVDNLITRGAEQALEYGFDIDMILDTRISEIRESDKPITSGLR